jgi:hypothetical protein
MNQREAVYKATHAVLREAGISFEDCQEGGIGNVITDELRKQVVGIVCEGFKKGEIELKDTEANRSKLANETELRAYTSGLVSNWHRKDKRFNGNETYKPKNPGSRIGQGDAQMKNLRLLRKKFEGTEKIKDIEAAIAKRYEELRAAKVKTVEVDWNEIPEELRAALKTE